MNEASPATFDFGTVATSYDSWYQTPMGRVYDRLEKRGVEQLLPGPGTGREMLEVGTGTGHWSSYFSERGFTVTGVDISPAMVNVARGKKIKRASFQVADAHRLPFDDGRFDAAAAVTTLEFVRSPDVVLKEMVRCTRRPGGVIIIGVLNALAVINQRRKESGESPYNAARLFSPGELKALLAPFGETDIITVAFVPGCSLLLPLARFGDVIARLLCMQSGAFLLGRVTLQ